jgi:SET domain-containing protein
MARRAPKFSIELRPSRIHGIGLFAARTIPKGTVIGREQEFIRERYYAWFTWREFARFDRALQRKVRQICTLERDGFYAPRDFDLLPTCWYMNHSCTGNIGFNRGEDFIAIRRIRADEELTYDYALVETAPNLRWRCKCRSKQCRGVVTGNDWKEPALRRRVGRYFHPYIRATVRREAGR